jgi:hypothetical protein
MWTMPIHRLVVRGHPNHPGSIDADPEAAEAGVGPDSN